jgi:hypothetical protein
MFDAVLPSLERAIRAVSLVAWSMTASGVAAAEPPFVRVVGDDVRVRAQDRLISNSDHERSTEANIRLHALRDETVAFQIVIETADGAADGVTVDIPDIDASLRVDRFVEHHVRIDRRSHGRDSRASLGWSRAARPPDGEMLGDVPDALIPIDVATARGRYPMRVPAGSLAAVWIDVHVASDAPASAFRSTVQVRADGARAREIPLEIEVGDATVPFRAVSTLVYYGPDELTSRMGADSRVEDGTLQLLHAHHVDPLLSLRAKDDAARLLPAMSGELFTPAHGYGGPGQALGPRVVALGTYGTLGDPTPESLATVRAILPAIPGSVEDVVLYAVDEQCRSPRGSQWRAALRRDPSLARIDVLQTCSEDARGQAVDVAMVTTDAFDPVRAAEARRTGKDVWVYNGLLPHAGTLLLDAPPSGLMANGWIAAAYDVSRWFYWESTFWNDDNRGGRGPVDPFVTAESFHNQHGDAALGDGILLYPGRQLPPFSGTSMEADEVFPSIRLKMLRRGILDAGYLALARSAHPREVDAILLRVVPRALGEADPDRQAPWMGARDMAMAREELRALIPGGAILSDAEAGAVLRAGSSRRGDAPRTVPRQPKQPWLGYAAVVAALSLLLISRRRRRAKSGGPLTGWATAGRPDSPR